MMASETGPEGDDPLVDIVGLEKQFAGTRALKGVSIRFRRGEIHGLLGENGAGKSTLIKILTGVYAPSAGRISLDGEPVRIDSPLAAHRLGLGAVYQDAELVSGFTVGQNVLLGNEPGGALIDNRKLHAEARTIVENMGIDLDVHRLAGDLTAAEMQLVTLATLFQRRYKLIVLDEPTARLSAAEVDILFALIERFRDRGITIVYISHRLSEIGRICDRITILRGGLVAATLERDSITEERVTELMVAKSRDQLKVDTAAPTVTDPTATDPTATDQVLLQVEDLRTARLEPLSFTVRAGEVLGITGPVGGGMEQIARALGGVVPHGGAVRIDGKPVAIPTPRAARAAGIALVPEDRRRQALFPELALADNVALPVLGKLSRFGLIRGKLKLRYAAETAERLAVRPAAPTRPVKFFSGGNQQKAVIGKWMSAKARLFIFVEPTAGVDVGAIKEIYDTVLALARAGAAVILISSAVEEIMTLAETVMVVHDGRLVHRAPRADCTHDRLLTLSLGGRSQIAV